MGMRPTELQSVRHFLWTRDVKLDDVPSSLFCRADWLARHTPSDSIYDEDTTPFFHDDSEWALLYNNQEFEASTIVMSPGVTYHEDIGIYEVSNGDDGDGDWKFCLDYLVEEERAVRNLKLLLPRLLRARRGRIKGMPKQHWVPPLPLVSLLLVTLVLISPMTRLWRL